MQQGQKIKTETRKRHRRERLLGKWCWGGLRGAATEFYFLTSVIGSYLFAFLLNHTFAYALFFFYIVILSVKIILWLCTQTLSCVWFFATPRNGACHGILEQVAIFYSGGSSWPRDRTGISRIARSLFTTGPSRSKRKILGKSLQLKFPVVKFSDLTTKVLGWTLGFKENYIHTSYNLQFKVWRDLNGNQI